MGLEISNQFESKQITELVHTFTQNKVNKSIVHFSKKFL